MGARIRLIDVSQMLLVGVFLYSVVSKILDYNDYYSNLMHSPLFQANEVPSVSYLIIIAELATVAMLIVSKTRKSAFGLAIFLLTSFSLYLIAVASFFPATPCGCGGILSKLGFGPHITLNLVSATFAVIGFLKSEP